MEGLTFYGGIVLAILVVVGTIYEAVKYYRGMFFIVSLYNLNACTSQSMM